MADNTGTPGPHETKAPGWPTVESYFEKYDQTFMENYSDDIDNLLILDGLFSAVITAFIIPAYGLLQLNTSQLSNDLLSRLVLHFEGEIIAAAHSPPVKDFQPSIAARWINSLWFVGLLLSLGSALLGILAKQWIREFLSWNNPTASARQNVLVRQIRAEAWESWRVNALIVTIPLLLEMAIVLFVSGLVVFVWSIDVVVAIVVASSVFLFIVLFAVLTILPTLFKCCPYRSPTSWAIIASLRLGRHFVERITRAILEAWNRCIALWRCFSSPGLLPSYGSSHEGLRPHPSPLSSRTVIHSYAKSVGNNAGDSGKTLLLEEHIKYSWRERDLEGKNIDRLIDLSGRPSKAPIVLLAEHDMQVDILRTNPTSENNDLAASTVSPETPATDEKAMRTKVLSIDEVHTSISSTISEPDILFRALSWISARSEDPNMLHQFAECAKSIHKDKLADEDINFLKGRLLDGVDFPGHVIQIALLAGFRNLSLWYLLTRMHGGEGAAARSFVSLIRLLRQRAPQLDAHSVASRMIRKIRTVYHLDAGGRIEQGHEEEFPPIPLDFDTPAELPFLARPTLSHLRVSGFVLASDVKSAVLEMLSEDVLALETSPARAAAVRLLRFLHRSVAETLSTFRSVLLVDDYVGQSAWEDFVGDCFDILVDTYNTIVRHHSKTRFDSVYPGLRSSLVDLMTRFALVDVMEDGTIKLLHIFQSKRSISWFTPTWARAALRFPRIVYQAEREDFHIYHRFVSLAMTSTEWMSKLSMKEVDDFYAKLINTLEFTVVSQLKNAGSFLPLEWLTALSANDGEVADYMFRMRKDTLISILTPILLHLELFDGARIALYKVLFELFVPVEQRLLLRPNWEQESSHRQAYAHLVLHYPLDATLAGPRWFNLFVWAADQWLRDAAHAHRHGWTAGHVSEVLQKMCDALDHARIEGWQLRNPEMADFPWPASMLPSPDGPAVEAPAPQAIHTDGAAPKLRTPRSITRLLRDRRLASATSEESTPSYASTGPSPARGSGGQRGIVRDTACPADDRVHSTIELLDGHAPEVLRALATKLQAALETDEGLGDTTVKDMQELENYLHASPEEKHEVLRRRVHRLKAEAEEKRLREEEERRRTEEEGRKREQEEDERERHIAEAAAAAAAAADPREDGLDAVSSGGTLHLSPDGYSPSASERESTWYSDTATIKDG